MMRVRQHGRIQNPGFPCGSQHGKLCRFRHASALIVLVLIVVTVSNRSFAQQTFTLAQSPGGLGFTQAGNNYSSSFGTMNALGIGTPTSGLTVAALSTGALYFTQYQIVVSGFPGPHILQVTGFVGTNFVHPAAEIVQSCPSTAACTGSGGYSAMSINAGAPTTVVPSMSNGTVTVGLGIFLPDNDGAGAFTGNDSCVVTLTLTDTTNGKTFGTATISLTTPAETVQNAVQLTLGTATGGLTIAPAADYSMNFGNVNGLGIGPGAGLTTMAASGGIIYSTPYMLNPAFSDFASTTATISVFVSPNFANPTILKLNDAAASAGPYNLISTNAGAPTQITAGAGDRIAITRHLGLFVSNINGPTAFNGTDNATLTFTLTVP
jgi:hypothetical protein